MSIINPSLEAKEEQERLAEQFNTEKIGDEILALRTDLDMEVMATAEGHLYIIDQKEGQRAEIILPVYLEDDDWRKQRIEQAQSRIKDLMKLRGKAPEMYKLSKEAKAISELIDGLGKKQQAIITELNTLFGGMEYSISRQEDSGELKIAGAELLSEDKSKQAESLRQKLDKIDCLLRELR